MPDFSDSPIRRSEDDRYGFDPFAKAIAGCIDNIKSPTGSAVAVYGPWGSGKTSVINLALQHLKSSNCPIDVISFQCWHYRTEDAMAIGFFRELHAGLTPVLSRSNRAREALTKLGSRLAAAGPLLGSILSATAGPILGDVSKSAFAALEKFIQADESTDELQHALATALDGSDTRFLFVIDDLDRLAPEEALVVFRLIKSVGRLPNVLYLLAYDRDATEKAISNKFPSEGSHYLEKIVQAGFELPEPGPTQLGNTLLEQLDTILGDAVDFDQTYFANVFYDAITPELRTPRDVIRLSNNLFVTWQAIRGEVNPADFIAIETLRLFRPRVYRAISSNKIELVGGGAETFFPSHSHADVGKRYELALLPGVREEDQSKLKQALMRLFPRLDGVWSNTHHREDDQWATDRRVCSAPHFDTYFRFAISESTVPVADIREIFDRSDDEGFVRETFGKALICLQAEGRTKASYLIEEITFHADELPLCRVAGFLATMFAIADDLLSDADKRRPFDFVDNFVRLHRMVRALLLERTSLEDRSRILISACQGASLGWLVDISALAYQEHHGSRGRADDASELPDQCLVTEEAAQRLRAQALCRVRSAADDNSILCTKNLRFVLFQWRNMEDETDELRRWCARAVASNDSLVLLARAFLDVSYSASVGQRMPMKNDQAKVGGLETLMDVPQFRRRLTEVVDSPGLNQEDRQMVQRLLAAWSAEDRDEH